MFSPSFLRRRFQTALAASLALVAAGPLSGCSSGGAQDGYGLEKLDMQRGDGGLPDGRPSPFDQARPQPRTQVDFVPAVEYPTDLLAYQIAVGRFNNDAFPDLLTGGQSQVTVYMNRGNGTFETRPVLLGFGANWQVGAEDLNGDGLSDLLLTDGTDSRIAVAIGKGDGTFKPPSAYLAGIKPQAVVAVALNNDAALDLVASNTADGTLRVLLNNGDGTFRVGGSYSASGSTMGTPFWLARGDMNRDNKQDIVVSNYSLGALTLLLGNGDGTLQPARQIGVFGSPAAVEVGDLNRDGNLDVAVISEKDQRVGIFMGTGDGNFTMGAPLAVTAMSGQGVHIGDVNGDNILDVVATCAFSNQARVFIGRGDGTFAVEKLFPSIGSSPFNVAIADLNLDGLNDLALSEGLDRKISILINKTMP